MTEQDIINLGKLAVQQNFQTAIEIKNRLQDRLKIKKKLEVLKP